MVEGEGQFVDLQSLEETFDLILYFSVICKAKM